MKRWLVPFLISLLILALAALTMRRMVPSSDEVVFVGQEPRFHLPVFAEPTPVPEPRIDYSNLHGIPGFPYWNLPRTLGDPGARRVPIPHGPKGVKPTPIPCE